MDTPNWAMHYAELLSDEDGDCTVVKVRGQDVYLEYTNGVDVWRGWLREGESLADIKWKVER